MTDNAMPQSPEAEEGFLGLVLWHNRRFPEVTLRAEDFYRQVHRHIYQAILTLSERDDAIDPITVSEVLETMGVEDIQDGTPISYLYELQHREIDQVNFDSLELRAATYARSIVQSAERRRLIVAAGAIMSIADSDVGDPLGSALSLLQDLNKSKHQKCDANLEFLEFTELQMLPAPKWLVYRFLPTKGVNFLYGPAGEGKTYTAIGLNIAVASEEIRWAGLATKHGHCIYIAAEDIDEVAQRFIGCANYHQIEDIPNLHIFPAPLQLTHDTPRLIESIKNRYGDINIAMITIDTLSMCALGVEENSKREFDAVTAALESLWRTFDCCVVAVHHTGRNGELRGTSSMDGVAYSMIKVTKADESVLLHSTKARRGKGFEDFYLDWENVDVPGAVDEMGEQVTTSVLISSSRSATDTDKLTKLQREILEHLHNLGGTDIPRTELMKACVTDPAKERTFINTISALSGKGLVKISKIKQRTYYSLTEKVTEYCNFTNFSVSGTNLPGVTAVTATTLEGCSTAVTSVSTQVPEIAVASNGHQEMFASAKNPEAREALAQREQLNRELAQREIERVDVERKQKKREKISSSTHDRPCFKCGVMLSQHLSFAPCVLVEQEVHS